jgi:arginyl-tRNA synthetase
MNLLDIKNDLESSLGYTINLNRELKNGIFSTNQAFIEAKNLKINPKIAVIKVNEVIESFLNHNYTNLFSCNISGAYVNISLTTQGYMFIDSAFSNKTLNDKIFLDYVSPNVAKELHLGHMRNMDIGDSIRRLLLIKYPNLITDNHWGDWGVQFGILIWTYKQFVEHNLSEEVNINDEILPINLAIFNQDKLQGLIRMYIWSTQNKANYPDYDNLVRQEFLKLENGDKTNTQLWNEFKQASIEAVNTDMRLFNIPKHDLEQGESYYEPFIHDIYNFFEVNQLWTVDGKARYINFEELSIKINQPSIKSLGYGYLVSSTGYTTYLFRDIVARLNWINEHQADKMITVTGNEQLHHFKQLFTICDYLSTLKITDQICKKSQNLQSLHLQHIAYGFLTLKGGKKMSTRNGVIYNSRDLYTEVFENAKSSLLSRDPNITLKEQNHKARIMTLAAIKWQDLGKDTIHNIEFDLQSLLSFEGNTGMYQLYTIARINSIIKKNQAMVKAIDYETLTTEELLILDTYLTTPIVLNDAIDKLKPHIIVNFCYDLANQINSWYNTTNVSNEINPIRKATLIVMLMNIKQKLESLLETLGIDVVESI